jgi:AbiJ N-terminal domain 4
MDNLLYSKRKKMIAQANQPEVYQYDQLPIEFRRQIVHIWTTTISIYSQYFPFASGYWNNIHTCLTRELGLFQLGLNGSSRSFNQCCDFLLDRETHIDNILDLIELTFQTIEHVRENEHLTP